MECTAIKTTGHKCTVHVIANTPLCRLHQTLQVHTGPNTFARKQLTLTHRAALLALNTTYDTRIIDARLNNLPHHQLNTERNVALADMRAEHRIAKRELSRRQQELIDATGVDPDADANARRTALLAAANARRLANQARVVEARALRANWEAQQAHGVRALAQFIADPQNVHTSEAVRQTKDVVAKVLQIPVPEEYRWHPVRSSKTPFEIGIECKLSQKAAWQMISQYAQDVAIYDIEPGIYGKVLDSVWQYVKGSANKDELCVIVSQELQDNVGMCAQGNLSRVCNILSGYLDGVAPPESTADKLGRLLPPLAVIDDAYDRFIQAAAILKDNNVPRDHWHAWMDALRVEDEDEEALHDVLASS